MPPGKYDPLLAYLRALPLEQTTVTLTVAALEALSGPLSPSARTSASYWTEVTHSHAWRTTGWTARLGVGAPTVTCTRRPPDAQR